MAFEPKNDGSPVPNRLTLNTQGAESNATDAFTIFREEEEMDSNVAVGAASLLCNAKSPIGDGVHSSSGFLHIGENSIDDEDDANHSRTTRDGEPKCLTLNQENLAHFESSVQEGKVPLRTDVVGITYVDGRASRLAMAAARMDTSVVTNAQSPLEADAPLNQQTQMHIDTISVSDMTNHVSQGCENKELTTVSPITGASQMPSRNAMSKTNISAWDNASMFGAETITCSTLNQNDLLNEKNLKLHVDVLYSGFVASLKSENLPLSLPSKATQLWLEQANNQENSSGCCELSDAMLGSEIMSAELSLYRSNSSTNLRSIVLDGSVLDELWSMETNHAMEASVSRDGGGLGQIDSSPKLNKKSLRKLRQQIKSGNVPLRPEVLSGLNGIDFGIKRVPRSSPSMYVEVPSDDLNSQKKNKRLYPSMCFSPHSPDHANCCGNSSKNSVKKNCLKLRSLPLGTLISDTAGISLCSISVEASERERVGETVSGMEGNDCSSIDHDARFRDEEGEARNENSMFLTHDLSTVHDEVSNLKQRMSEMTEYLKKTRDDQELLAQQMKGMREDMRASLQCLKPASLKDLQRTILNLQSQLEMLKTTVMDPQHSQTNRSAKSEQVRLS